VTLPNFLVIGAPKAGSGSLYDYLRPHPDIFMTEMKEPRFFAYNGQQDRLKYPVRTLEEYEALFEGVRHEKAIGEATPIYFWFKDSPQRIKDVIPDARLIVSLREPVQRAFSIYHMNLRTRGRNEGRSFLEALATDEVLQRKYRSSLQPYFDRFERERIKVILFDDLAKDTAGTVRCLFEFLGVDPDFRPDFRISNPGGVPKSKQLHRLLTDNRIRLLGRRYFPEPVVDLVKNVRSSNLAKDKMVMTDAEREAAYGFFERDILETQDLIGMDLSHWLHPAPVPAAGRMTASSSAN
jgi:hypothetical protein